MLTRDASHADASLVVHRDEGTDRVQIGVDLDGVFVPFFETKLSLFDEFHRRGLEQQEAEQRASSADEPQQQQQQ